MSIQATQYADARVFETWREKLTGAIETLRKMAGTTEHEFLNIGSRLHSFYDRSSGISSLSGRLVNTVSADAATPLTERLNQMINGMEGYLDNSRSRSDESCQTLEQVQKLLDQLSEPLDGFQKMNKSLRMLSISTKIESARLGELGSGFVNLALDVEKLSQQVHEKSSAIASKRQFLLGVIAENLAAVRSKGIEQDQKVRSILAGTSRNLESLVLMNSACSNFALTASVVSAEVSASISDVVSSMQMHDMTRQQFEHVVEALERLADDLSCTIGADNSEEWLRLVIEAGDVCELQEAQLRFASGELFTAVGTILDSLREIARKQGRIAQESASVTGASNGSGSSFVDEMSRGMTAVTTALNTCAETDRNMGLIMASVAHTIEEIASFVIDIEEIGTEIDLIALNSQIKAALTGPEGAALGVLAEAIKRLSDEAVRQTNNVAANLNEISSVTSHILEESSSDYSAGDDLGKMQIEIATVLRTIGSMNSEMSSIMQALDSQVFALNDDIERATASVDVHYRTKEMSDGVMQLLQSVVDGSRQIEPASSQFMENLRHMEKHYTMESERHIHEALARKRSGLDARVPQQAAAAKSVDESEFGDNVDLF